MSTQQRKPDWVLVGFGLGLPLLAVVGMGVLAYFKVGVPVELTIEDTAMVEAAVDYPYIPAGEFPLTKYPSVVVHWRYDRLAGEPNGSPRWASQAWQVYFPSGLPPQFTGLKSGELRTFHVKLRYTMEDPQQGRNMPVVRGLNLEVVQ